MGKIAFIFLSLISLVVLAEGTPTTPNASADTIQNQCNEPLGDYNAVRSFLATDKTHDNWPRSALQYYTAVAQAANLLSKGRTDIISETQFRVLLMNGIKVRRLFKSTAEKKVERMANRDMPINFPDLDGDQINSVEPWLTNEAVAYIQNYQFTQVDLAIDELLNLKSIHNFYLESAEISPTQDPFGTWRGLPPYGLNTPYFNLSQALHRIQLPDGALVADMGSGAGRLGMIIGAQFKHLNYAGYEYHEYRMAPAVATAKRLGYNNVSYHHADFADAHFALPDADLFFIYYSNSKPEVMNALVNKLKALAKKKSFYVLISTALGNSSQDKNALWLDPVLEPKIPLSVGLRLFKTRFVPSDP